MKSGGRNLSRTTILVALTGLSSGQISEKRTRIVKIQKPIWNDRRRQASWRIRRETDLSDPMATGAAEGPMDA